MNTQESKMEFDENPVNCETARAILGKPGPPWPRYRIYQIRKAMGITSRWFFVSEVRKWLRHHPDFKASDWQGKQVDGPGPSQTLLNALPVEAQKRLRFAGTID